MDPSSAVPHPNNLPIRPQASHQKQKNSDYDEEILINALTSVENFRSKGIAKKKPLAAGHKNTKQKTLPRAVQDKMVNGAASQNRKRSLATQEADQESLQRSPDARSGPEEIAPVAQGILASYEPASKMVREFKAIVTYGNKIGRGAFGSVRSGILSGPAAENLGKVPNQKNIPGLPKPKTVAVKSFISKTFEREIAIVEKMIQDKPPGVLRLYGIFKSETDMQSHLVKKFCNDGTLADFYERNTGNKPLCYRKTLEIMKIVEAFHEAGYCHRDIWEENFLCHKKKSGETMTYLADFGHAEKVGSDPANSNAIPQVSSMAARPLKLVNCSVAIIDSWRNAKRTNHFESYQNLIDQQGMSIDNFQLGMLLFRVATMEPKQNGDADHRPDQENNQQQDLKNFLQEQVKARLGKDAIPKHVIAQYLLQIHPEIPSQIREVIAGLLETPEPMPLRTAIKLTEKYLIK